MDINGVLGIILIIVFIVVGIVLALFIVELIKTMKSARKTIDNIEPTLKNIEDITTNIQPTLAKIDPLMDRVQLMLDSVNVEIMRVDQILEDVSEITDTASSATAAVDSITNVPLKAVNTMASRVKSVFGGKSASDESAQLAEQRVAVAQALKDYEKAEEKGSGRDSDKGSKAATAAIEEAPAIETFDEAPQPYERAVEGTEPVIDPNAIAESTFFDDNSNA